MRGVRAETTSFVGVVLQLRGLPRAARIDELLASCFDADRLVFDRTKQPTLLGVPLASPLIGVRPDRATTDSELAEALSAAIRCLLSAAPRGLRLARLEAIDRKHRTKDVSAEELLALVERFALASRTWYRVRPSRR
jgi:hypothetical protein